MLITYSLSATVLGAGFMPAIKIQSFLLMNFPILRWGGNNESWKSCL